jgi:MtN3 and saliva related transmembrane protein
MRLNTVTPTAFANKCKRLHSFYDGKHCRTNIITCLMNLTDLIGYIAASLTTFSFIPQALHTFKTKDVRGISLGMYSVFTTGIALWLLYGLMLQAWPIVAANAITLLLAGTILVMKLKYR